MNRHKNNKANIYFWLCVLSILAVFFAGMIVGKTFAEEIQVTSENEFIGEFTDEPITPNTTPEQTEQDTPTKIMIPPQGPFNPEDNPKTADETDVKMILTGVVISIYLLRYAMFENRRREEKDM